MKRRAESTDTSLSKMSRNSDPARDWGERAGMILEVNLRNFMCHEVGLVLFPRSCC